MESIGPSGGDWLQGKHTHQEVGNGGHLTVEPYWKTLIQGPSGSGVVKKSSCFCAGLENSDNYVYLDILFSMFSTLNVSHVTIIKLFCDLSLYDFWNSDHVTVNQKG